MLAHAEATRNMPPRKFIGTLGLLILGGNGTTPQFHERLRR
jgi:hypothetical protein